jgi:hypothetical protein
MASDSPSILDVLPLVARAGFLGDELLRALPLASAGALRALAPQSATIARGLRARCSLHAAAALGRPARLEALLAQPGCDPNAPDGEGFTPLALACMRGRAVCARVLLADARTDPAAGDAVKGLSALQLAARAGGPAAVVSALCDCARVDLAARDATGWSPQRWLALHAAQGRQGAGDALAALRRAAAARGLDEEHDWLAAAVAAAGAGGLARGGGGGGGEIGAVRAGLSEEEGSEGEDSGDEGSEDGDSNEDDRKTAAGSEGDDIAPPSPLLAAATL